jgi:hypothetical protein
VQMAGFGAIDRMLEDLMAGALKSSAALAEAESAFVQPELESNELKRMAPER